MGVQSSRTSESPYSTLPAPVKRRKVPRKKWFLDLSQDVADVETLGLSFSVCRKIFLHLSLPDLSRCMLVCKEWRSLIETCSFWAVYRRRHYSNQVVEPQTGSYLSEWNYLKVKRPEGHQTSVKMRTSHYAADEDEDDAVFYPFPHLWRCQIVVPNKLQPPDASLDMHHSFLFAAHWLEAMMPVLKNTGMEYQAGVCLFHWTQPRMPTAKEVLDIFNTNPVIVQHTKEVQDFNSFEISTYYQMKPFLGISPDLFYWLIGRCGQRVLAFQVDESLVAPSPGFILTHLATGWVGGLIFASR